MIAEGNYKVKKVLSGFFGESAEKKTPYVSVEFLLENDNSISWVNYFTEKTDTQKFIDTMYNIGFVGNSFADLADESLSIDLLFVKPQEDYTVTIEHENYTDKSGNHRTRARVKWVNFANSIKKLSIDEAKKITGKFNLDGLWSKKNEGTPF